MAGPGGRDLGSVVTGGGRVSSNTEAARFGSAALRPWPLTIVSAKPGAVTTSETVAPNVLHRHRRYSPYTNVNPLTHVLPKR